MSSSPSLASALQQYQKAYDKAIQLHTLFADAEPAELLRAHEALVEEVESFLNISGLEWKSCGSLGRHLSFLDRYLKRDDKSSCAQDAQDIVFHDLPTALRNLVAQSTDDAHVDPRLREAVSPLMAGGHYDSAIRKVFVVMTDRLRRAFGVADKIDGEDLVNVVFGKGGKIPVALDDSQKLAMRNLISGFYGVYRNRFAHNDVEPDFAQARTVIEMANTIIIDIEALATSSTEIK
ncbi:TIGR02391 family protein [Burkholderia sp. 22PA0099]|uniref:TIGR02391 family protein n=1 Tax=Burkholderia sp. 22PA0099 TaxID=3237372 RepID=UPI0039C1638E